MAVGYPLFCIVAKLFASVAHFGSVAFRMNLSMAFVGAGASAFLYLTAFHVINCRSSAVLAAGLFALNPIVWTYSSHAEVFPLNNFLVCILLYLTVRFFETKDVNVARWGALVMGLGLTNQVSECTVPFTISQVTKPPTTLSQTSRSTSSRTQH